MIITCNPITEKIKPPLLLLHRSVLSLVGGNLGWVGFVKSLMTFQSGSVVGKEIPPKRGRKTPHEICGK